MSAGIDAITESTCIILVRQRPVLVALATELTSRRSFEIANALGIGPVSVLLEADTKSPRSPKQLSGMAAGELLANV
jgi:hypothetical protein